MHTTQEKVVFSLACIFEWLGDAVAEDQLRSFLSKQISYLDGFELCASFQDLNTWGQTLRLGKVTLPPSYKFLGNDLSRLILKKRANSVHLEDLKFLTKSQEDWLAPALNQIFHSTGISEFTVHPDQVSYARWEKLLSGLSPNISLSIENMCKRKKSHQMLFEVGTLLNRYPDLRFTFDICHWLEFGQSLENPGVPEFLNQHNQRISKVHFSVPSSNFPLYRNSKHYCHYLYSHSGFDLNTSSLLAFPKNLSWVIEGALPVSPASLKLLEEEIGFLRSSLNEYANDETLASVVSN